MSDASTSNDDLRRLILDTTRRLLVKKGYHNLSMRKIAQSIDYSATSIYLHFESKDALLHALIDEGMQQLYNAFTSIVSRLPDRPVMRLRALCERFITFGLKNPEYYEVMFQLRPEQMERYPAEKYRRARRNLDIVAEALAEGAEAGVFTVADARVSASTIWASLHGTVSLLLAERVDIRIDQSDFIETAIRQTLRSYTTRAVA